MKDEERKKYLAKKYFERTITQKEWEEVLWIVGQSEEPESVDELFMKEWMREGVPHKISLVTWEHIQHRWKSEQSIDSKKILTNNWKWAVAASILVLIGTIWWVWGEDQSFQVFETSFGETQEIVLDDGTLVTLNANSKLMWDNEWENSGVRLVELDGEAFFDVIHIEDARDSNAAYLPFRVRTSDLMVNVLGTAFNVSNRRGETDVFLEQGLVKLVLWDGKSSENKITGDKDERVVLEKMDTDEVLMKPGDHVSFSSKTKVLRKNEDKKYRNFLNWKNGTLSFRKMEFGKILTELEDIYGKRFDVQDKTLLSRKVTFAVPYENWETVYKLIEVTLNLEIIENNNNVVKIKKRAG